MRALQAVLFSVCFLCFFSGVGYGDFLPENELHLRMFSEAESNVSEEEFDAAIDEAEAFYTEIFSQHGATLQINRLWSNDTVNASASQQGDLWLVNMYGGLARAPEVTKDGFALVLCHEIGHHVGGFPTKGFWASNEGQSDYFATLSCASELWSDDDYDYQSAASEIPDVPKRLCDDAYYGLGRTKVEVCYRAMLAGKSLAELLNALGKGDELSWDTPDSKKVKRTDHYHPAAQCRLDTYMAGALCDVSFNPSYIPDSEAQSARHSCARVLGDKVGVKPRCWYAPKL